MQQIHRAQWLAKGRIIDVQALMQEPTYRGCLPSDPKLPHKGSIQHHGLMLLQPLSSPSSADFYCSSHAGTSSAKIKEAVLNELEDMTNHIFKSKGLKSLGRYVQDAYI